MGIDRVKEKMREDWNGFAVGYDDCYQHGLKSPQEKTAWMRFLSELVGTAPKKILDIGAGTGFLSLLFAEMGHEVKGVDLSPGMLEIARGKAERMGLSVEFREGDAENTGEPDGFYDVVINRHLLWAMPHPQTAVDEWARVLKPGGKLIVIDGDWFFNTFRIRSQLFLGNLLTAFVEKRNTFRDASNAESKDLPMTNAHNAKQAPMLLKAAGLTVSVTSAESVERVERKGMPFRQRLLNPYKRIVIIGKK